MTSAQLALTRYVGWQDKPSTPLGTLIGDAINAYQGRMGTPPVEVLVADAVLSEARAACPSLPLQGRSWLRAGTVYVG